MGHQSFYSGTRYDLPAEFLEAITRVRPERAWYAIAIVWIQIALLLALTHVLPFWCYPLLIFAIAGRQGALLQLIHEAAHGLLLRSERGNHLAAKWLCALPIGVFFEGYASGHRRHHAYTNTDRDPDSDREKYRVTDCRDPRLYLLFLKDLSGLTALGIFFAYKRTETGPSNLRALPSLCLVQAIVLVALFQGDLVHYLLYWLVPAASPHMFLMRVRGIAEHGLALQLGKNVQGATEGTFYTRSFLTPQGRYPWHPLVWLEKALIGSFGVHYHHEHHLFPNVPFYNLPAVHAAIADRVRAENPEVYARGYFAAAFRGAHAV